VTIGRNVPRDEAGWRDIGTISDFRKEKFSRGVGRIVRSI
jgi:hypothetical protein